jgi:DNA-binding response OmpR family regulator
MSHENVPRVLVLEEHRPAADDIGDALLATGFEVLGPCCGAPEALELINAEAIDVAVLDVSLHEERCFEIAQRLAERHVPFLLIDEDLAWEPPEVLRGHLTLHKPLDCIGLGRQLRALLSETAH